MTVCDVAWVETDPVLPHQTHQCVFNTTGPHSRHECRCGLNLHDNEVPDD